VLGHELLQEEGLPEVICRFASHHTGVGLSRGDVLSQKLPLPPSDYLAETVEERLVMYADKFHSKTTPATLLTADAYVAQVRQFGEDKVAAFESMRATFGEPDLSPFSTAYGQRVATTATWVGWTLWVLGGQRVTGTRRDGRGAAVPCRSKGEERPVRSGPRSGRAAGPRWLAGPTGRSGVDADMRLVRAGSLLHDAGLYRLLA
jgi:hypothetical protein